MSSVLAKEQEAQEDWRDAQGHRVRRRERWDANPGRLAEPQWPLGSPTVSQGKGVWEGGRSKQAPGAQQARARPAPYDHLRRRRQSPAGRSAVSCHALPRATEGPAPPQMPPAATRTLSTDSGRGESTEPQPGRVAGATAGEGWEVPRSLCTLRQGPAPPPTVHPPMK